MKNYGFYLAVIISIFTQNFAFAGNQQSVDLKFENVKEVTDTLFDRTTDGQIDSRSFGDKKFVCEKIDGREWVGNSDASGYCSMQVQDRAVIMNQGQKIYVQTFGDNADYCEFEGQVVGQKGQVIIARQSGLIYTDDQNVQHKDGVCEIQIAQLEQKLLIAPATSANNALICQRAICNGKATLKTVMALKK